MTEPRPVFIPAPSSNPPRPPRPSRFPALMWGAVTIYAWIAFFIYLDHAVTPADHAAVRLLGIACGAATLVAFVYLVRWSEESDRDKARDGQAVAQTDVGVDTGADE